jgi:hypothetical protein
LHDEKVRLRPQLPEHYVADHMNMPVRILVTGASEAHHSIAIESEFGWFKRGVLIGEQHHRLQPAIAERMSNGCHLDRFRPGADHQPDICEAQSSP